MKPSIGRIVHWVESGVHFAAIITRVHTDVCVNLTVFRDDHQHPAQATSASRADLNGLGEAPDHTWHWPEQQA